MKKLKKLQWFKEGDSIPDEARFVKLSQGPNALFNQVSVALYEVPVEEEKPTATKKKKRIAVWVGVSHLAAHEGGCGPYYYTTYAYEDQYDVKKYKPKHGIHLIEIEVDE